MKTLIEKCSSIVRLSLTAATLLLSQHALAVGTDAGTNIDNLATIDYSVGGSAQTEIESSPTGNSTPGANGTVTTFEVDLRVDFTFVEVGGAHTDVSPGDTDEFIAFTLTNTSNATLDFNLLATQLNAPGTVHLQDDTNVNMSNVRVRAANGDGGAGVPVLGDHDYVDELLEDATVVIYIFADATGAFVTDDYANFDLGATAAEGGVLNTEGIAHVDDIGNPDDPAVIDVVFAEGGALGDGILNALDGYHLISADLEITKVATVISDPFNGGADPKAIPGAIVEYVITVNNTGAEDADNVVITDSIDTDVNFIFDAYTGDDVAIVNDGAPQITPCNTDALDADTDGCALDGQDLTIGDPADLPITVTAGTLMTITYRVTIP